MSKCYLNKCLILLVFLALNFLAYIYYTLSPQIKIVIFFYTKKVFSMTLGANLISGRFVYALLILSERY